MQFVLDVQHDGRKLVLVLPPEAERDGSDYQLNFKFFQRVEGTFKLTPGSVLKGMQVRVFENGARTPKLTQTLNVSVTTKGGHHVRSQTQARQQAAEPDRLPDRRRHARRGQRHLQRRACGSTGRCSGNVIAEDGKPGTLVVSEQAQVEGEIRVSHVVINGAVIGPVTLDANTLNCRPRPMSQGMSITIRSRCSSAPWSRAAWCTRTQRNPTRSSS